MKTVRLGAGSGYWGDMLEPAVDLARRGNLDYLGFDFLAELTMSLLQRIKMKDPSRGYIPDVVPWMRALLPITHAQGTRMILNGGGTNCPAAAEAVLAEARRADLSGVRVAMIEGDDLTSRIGELRAAGVTLENLEDGSRSIDDIAGRIVSAHAYIGSESIVEALEQGAGVVIGGRIADSALYVGPLMHEFGWSFEDAPWDLLGAAITVGHVIECAGICCGGMSSQWKHVPEPWNMGFPIAEFCEDGNALITKLPGTGGLINQWTIKEHLLYETHDPADYRMPDGIADLTTVRVTEAGRDAVRLTDMSGRPRPDMLKVQIGYTDGWLAESRVLIPWPDTVAKADRCEEIIRRRLDILGVKPRELRFDRVGIDALAGPLARRPRTDPEEIELRVAARVDTREEAEAVKREVTHVTTIGPVGTAFGAPSRPREIIALWPTLVPRDLVPTTVTVEEVGSRVVVA
ncbi:acyclic terpene utilization AtuA family protein [Sphaerisporangium sp. NPDC088356]|uniref:acyclic terpene utilization AtuA family protein n=1 Tax=Sphaerisporangium sp. NPDC088356 TaxID=3154871 RepID=UPI0034397D75